MKSDISDTITALQPVLMSLITLFGVWLGWRLGANAQRIQRQLDLLRERMSALSQILKVVDDVPPDSGRRELFERLNTDVEFKRSLPGRMIRLFGLRTELIASLDQEVVQFLDERFRPLFTIAVGRYDLREDRLADFAAAAVDLRVLVQRVERRLVAEYEKLNTRAAQLHAAAGAARLRPGSRA